MDRWLALADKLIDRVHDGNDHDPDIVQCTAFMAMALMLRHCISEMEGNEPQGTQASS